MFKKWLIILFAFSLGTAKQIKNYSEGRMEESGLKKCCTGSMRLRFWTKTFQEVWCNLRYSTRMDQEIIPINRSSLESLFTFSPQEENSVTVNIRLLAKWFCGLSTFGDRWAAHAYDEKHNLKRGFKKACKLTWMTGVRCLWDKSFHNCLPIKRDQRQ